jgi:hypothetical protein
MTTTAANTAVSLFKHAQIGTELANSLFVRETTSGSKTVCLLPATAKGGGMSLKTVSGLTGQALKAYKRRQADGLKVCIAKECAGLAASSDWTGRKMTQSASGTVGFFLDPCEAAPITPEQVKASAKLLTDEELQAILDERKATKADTKAIDVSATVSK